MNTQTTKHGIHRRHGWWLLVIPAFVLGALGLAQARGLGGGPGCGLGLGMMGGGPGGGRPAFLAKHLDRMLDRVQATETQRAAIKPIVAELQAKLQPLHQQGAAIHDQLMEAFTAESVDAGVVENLRQQGFRLHEEGSRLVTDALVKISAQLTVEQRKQVVTHMKERRPRHRFGR